MNRQQNVKLFRIYILVTLVGCDIVMTSLNCQDKHPGVVVNRAQFGAGRLSSFWLVDKSKPKKRKNSCFVVLHS